MWPIPLDPAGKRIGPPDLQAAGSVDKLMFLPGKVRQLYSVKLCREERDQEAAKKTRKCLRGEKMTT